MRRMVFAAFLVAAALAATSGISTARAAFPGGNGLFVFDDQFTHDIYTIDEAGNGLKQLTSDGLSVTPRWSADGTKIVFSRRGNIWIMNADGSGQKQLTTTRHSFQPAFSPNGRTIAFVRVPAGGGPGQIWTIPVTGGRGTQLTHDAAACGDAHPVYSPAGGMIAYDQVGCSTRIRVVTYRPSTGVKHFIPAAWNPDFTADGKGVVFTSDDYPHYGVNWPDLFVSTVTGANPTSPLTRDTCTEGDPCFVDGSALPSSTLANHNIAWVRTIEGGDICIVTKTSIVGGTQFCKAPGFPLPENLDVQPTR
jgi:Tol biopolymer transport system component